MAPPFSERREDARYPLQVTVELHEGSGLTRDASASGVFFETAVPVPVDGTLTLVLRLSEGLPGTPVRLGCTGRVVRIERRDDRTGVGVALTSILASRDDGPVV
jgi:PilZ domain